MDTSQIRPDHVDQPERFGDKQMEINVFSPCGVGVVERLTGKNFADHIIADLERKTMAGSFYGTRLTNVQLATLQAPVRPGTAAA